MLRVKLKNLDAETERRKSIALAYAQGIQNPVIRQPIPASSTLTSLESHVFHLYVVRTEKRQALQEHLSTAGIQTLIHYPIPPHQQQAYKAWNEHSFPATELIHREVLSLPISPIMSDEEVAAVIQACNAFGKI